MRDAECHDKNDAQHGERDAEAPKGLGAGLLLVLGGLDELLGSAVNALVRHRHVVLDVVEVLPLLVHQLGEITVNVVDLGVGGTHARDDASAEQ